jgi:hypothetical protein
LEVVLAKLLAKWVLEKRIRGDGVQGNAENHVFASSSSRSDFLEWYQFRIGDRLGSGMQLDSRDEARATITAASTVAAMHPK